MKHSLEKYYDAFEVLECRLEPDGLGGMKRTCTPGVRFRGALSQTPCAITTVAGQVIPRHAPVLLHETGVSLAPPGCVRRCADGVVYRVRSASQEVRSPIHSDLPFAEAMVERLVIPC